MWPAVCTVQVQVLLTVHAVHVLFVVWACAVEVRSVVEWRHATHAKQHLWLAVWTVKVWPAVCAVVAVLAAVEGWHTVATKHLRPTSHTVKVGLARAVHV